MGATNLDIMGRYMGYAKDRCSDRTPFVSIQYVQEGSRVDPASKMAWAVYFPTGSNQNVTFCLVFCLDICMKWR